VSRSFEVVMRRVVALGCVVVLEGCTRSNPAFDDDGGGQGSTTTDPLGSSSAPSPSEGDPDASGSIEGSGVATSSIGTGHMGDTGQTSEPGDTGQTGESGDTGPEDPPQVGPFDTPVPLPFNDPFAEDDDPTLPADMLELYFASRRVLGGLGQDDIWVVRRAQATDPWGDPEAVLVLNSVFRDNTPEISLDGLTMLMSSDRGSLGLQAEDVFVSTRMTRMSDWSSPELVAGLSSDGRDVCPVTTADGLHTYMCVGPGTLQDLVRFDRDDPAAAWSAPPMPVMELNTMAIECGPWLDESMRLLVFVSDRPGTAGVSDLWLASRDAPDQPFANVVSITELNSGEYEDDPWVSPDGGTVYFSSTLSGAEDIYVAQRIVE
jgi:hypothetical protein